MRVIGKAALLATAVMTLVGAGAGSARAGGLDGAGGDGDVATAQDGDQNFDCGNSHELVTVNALHDTGRQEMCTDRGYSRLGGIGVLAVGGTSVGPQSTTAQSGRQNLHCGNSADVLTVNVAGTVREETTCRAEYGPEGSSHGPGSGGGPQHTSAVGGTSLGPQLTTAQSGRQNLDCGNSADMLTLNALGTVEEKTTCVAVDRSDGPARHHGGLAPGKATAESGTSLGPQSATAQNGRQNLHCGSDDDLVGLPVLGETSRTVTCRAVDRSTAGH